MNQETCSAEVQASTGKKRVGWGETLAYGSGNFAEMMVFNPATTFMVFFYTDIAGIAAAAVGTLMLFSRVFDLLNPVAGLMVDRTRSRHGKARPWLLWMAVPFGISAVLLFSAPSLSPLAKIIYAFITYNLALTIIYSFIDIPFASLLPLVTQEQNERTKLSLSRMIQGQFGGLISYAVTLPLVAFFGGGARGWQNSFVVFGVVATLLLFVCFFFTRERVKPVSVERAIVPVKTAFAALLRNRYWLLLAVLLTVLFLQMGFYGANPYFCRYFLHDVNRFGPLMSIYQGVLVGGMLVVGPVIKKLGKRNAALLGIGVTLLGQLLMFTAPSSYAVVLTGTVIKALGSAPLVGTVFAMVADTIEYGEWKLGVRAEGLAYGTITLAAKISVGLGNALVGGILGVAGYVSGAAAQTATVLFAVKVMFLHVPLVLFIVAGIVLWNYDLDRKYASILADLKARRDAAV